METEILTRLNIIETRYKRLKNLFAGFIMLAVISLSGIAFTQTNSFNIVRAKGIIIEDQAGRERILIGAPVPFSKDRVRTDTAMVRKLWASKVMPGNPEQYMEYYNKYSHSAQGMVVMNEEGFDRVLIGDQLADANTGKRMFDVAGITWNNPKGFELGGAGVNTGSDGKSRAVIGLDDTEGEAVHLVALEDGTKGLMIGGQNGSLLIGMSRKNGHWFKNKAAFTGMKFFDSEGNMVWEQQMNREK